MNLIIIGPQACGKGTQAEKLSNKYDLAHIEMGDILRSVAKQESLLGEKIKEYTNSGRLVPDEIIVEVLNDRLQSLEKIDGFIFDGFPRIISQAEYLDKFLFEKSKKIDLVINLVLPRDVSIKRLMGRRTCSQCKKVYNLVTNPPKKEDQCDECGGKLVIREDETMAVIETRLAVFEEQTKPVIEFYEKRGILEKIDGTLSIEEIFSEINQRLCKRGLTVCD